MTARLTYHLGLSREPATRKEMITTVLGTAHRGKGVLKYVLGEASDALKKTVGFQLKTVPADKPYHVKDTYYVTNVLVRGIGRLCTMFRTPVLCTWCDPDLTHVLIYARVSRTLLPYS